ncbi:MULTISPECIES: hypothetical protein [unclassified Sphingopyxis]|uniref:hypothetical protein n=1 Tax=unclassified Sphingopyxis TaxID=2614943 RepID=UPI0028596A48|nr:MULTISPECIES: hypothetical protein [unclassified Sphingopyxis]MDR7061208.1 hypothetical protein [Sphingopyxis sp. BE235]MDR7182061.1 hypothetical protein [Sphingopyxis sp. BE249]
MPATFEILPFCVTKPPRTFAERFAQAVWQAWCAENIGAGVTPITSVFFGYDPQLLLAAPDSPRALPA